MFVLWKIMRALLFCDTRFEIRPFALLPLVPFYAPWKHEKSPGFLIFSGGIEKKIVAWKRLPATCNLLKVLTYFYEPLSMRVFIANTKKIYNPFGYNSHKLHWSYWTLRFEYCTRRGCLHEISSFRAEWNIFNSVFGLSLVTTYMRYPEIKLIAGLISLRSFWQKWNFI